VGALTVDPYRMYERKKAILQEDGTYTFWG
jgi:hypothetical protein